MATWLEEWWTWRMPCLYNNISICSARNIIHPYSPDDSASSSTSLALLISHSHEQIQCIIRDIKEYQLAKKKLDLAQNSKVILRDWIVSTLDPRWNSALQDLIALKQPIERSMFSSEFDFSRAKTLRNSVLDDMKSLDGAGIGNVIQHYEFESRLQDLILRWEGLEDFKFKDNVLRKLNNIVHVFEKDEVDFHMFTDYLIDLSGILEKCDRPCVSALLTTPIENDTLSSSNEESEFEDLEPISEDESLLNFSVKEVTGNIEKLLFDQQELRNTANENQV
jgi:hypothetical protein